MNQTTNNNRLRKVSLTTPPSRMPSVQWLFRSNIPRRRTSYLPPDIRKRNFFGMSEVIGVITNPAETVRSLTESRRLLDEARREINENRERSQLRPKHTFSRLPSFFPRKSEVTVVERALEGDPSFTILFGASSVGKTALLREVLSRPRYHVLHFDLRIAGFADLPSLYISLSQQMELYFEEISKIDGFESFETESWGFKHDRIAVERRIAESNDSNIRPVQTSDVARLMELFQSSLLKYWEFNPITKEEDHKERLPQRQDTDGTSSDKTHVEGSASRSKSKRWGFRTFRKSQGNEKPKDKGKGKERETSVPSEPNEKDGEKEKVVKKMPVIFFDEAHKLPALIHSTETMKCLLDSMLVLTKQDRLCHVIHATSDPFYQTWLRQLNVMQHCKIITIGDPSKSETRIFYRDRILPSVPEQLRRTLDFESLYEVFGGKLAHWNDYITDYVNSNGTIDVRQCSHFLQAHALLNLHIIHSSQAPGAQQDNGGAGGNADTVPAAANTSNNETIHPSLGPAGFRIYSPITHPYAPGGSYANGGGVYPDDAKQVPEFSAMQLLKVMSRLAQPETPYLPYFHLCREIGVRAVDGMVKGRVLDLRWTECVTREGEEITRVPLHASHAGFAGRPMGSNTTAVEVDIEDPPPPMDEDEDMVPVTEHELRQREHERETGVYDEVLEIVGPKLVPTTPIMRFAMREVVQEYEDDQSVSEYASLSDVDEY